MFKWEKKGMIFSPTGSVDWMNSHAQCPYTILFKDFIRIYFCTREKQDVDKQFKSYSGYIDVSRKNPKKILEISQKPIINLGKLGEFDEFGSMAGSVVYHKNQYFLYYCGWQRAVSTPYNWAIGMAKSKDGKNFKKIGKGPVVGPNFDEPYLQACPIVYKTSDTEWHMFYLSGTKWIQLENGKKESQYLLMYAFSSDGFSWKRQGKPIVDPLVEDECQTSCSIIKINDKYHMFFSYRYGINFRNNPSRGYRIGYAVSDDMLTWIRDDTVAGLNISEKGWDSEMVAYPHVMNVDGQIIMFYCGNHFGQNGFGYAVLQE